MKTIDSYSNLMATLENEAWFTEEFDTTGMIITFKSNEQYLVEDVRLTDSGVLLAFGEYYMESVEDDLRQELIELGLN